jgi:hypothetical protein
VFRDCRGENERTFKFPARAQRPLGGADHFIYEYIIPANLPECVFTLPSGWQARCQQKKPRGVAGLSKVGR